MTRGRHIPQWDVKGETFKRIIIIFGMYLSSAVNPVQYISLIIALSVLYVIDISTAKH